MQVPTTKEEEKKLGNVGVYRGGAFRRGVTLFLHLDCPVELRDIEVDSHDHDPNPGYVRLIFDLSVLSSGWPKKGSPLSWYEFG